MNILAIDTSSTSGSIAISKNNKICFISYMDLRITHSERLMKQIDTGLKNSKTKVNELDAILISNGPGSFTGVRIGLSTAKGMAMGLKIPLVPFNTLKMIAATETEKGKDILVLRDAKMNEIYGAVYSEDLEEIISPENAKPEEFLKKVKGEVIAVGDGVEKYDNLLREKKINYEKRKNFQALPLASNLFYLYEMEDDRGNYSFEDLASLEPYYLRKSQAELKKS